ncbi:MAG: hypothetical protein WCO51_11955, partial [bacterium]
MNTSSANMAAADTGSTSDASDAPISSGATKETVNNNVSSQEQVASVVHAEQIDLVNVKDLGQSDIKMLARLRSETLPVDPTAMKDAAISIRNDMRIADICARASARVTVERYFWA